jgi:hypothetical protein
MMRRNSLRRAKSIRMMTSNGDANGKGSQVDQLLNMLNPGKQ